MSFPVGAAQSLQHALCGLFFHLEEREVAHQVDSSDFYPTPYVRVDKPDKLIGEQVVVLAQVDEEARIARFGFAVVFAGGTFLAFLFLAVGTGVGGCFDVLTVAVVVREAVELVAHHAFDEVFLREPVQFAVDVGHEVGNLFLVHFYLFQVVDDFHQLSFADFLGGGHFSGFEFLADDAFYFTHTALFTQVDDGD